MKNGKPAPDLFNLAIQRSGSHPSKCIVVEDSLLGIQAAKSAEAFVLGFTGSFSREQLKNAGADLVVSTYIELIDLINNLGI